MGNLIIVASRKTHSRVTDKELSEKLKGLPPLSPNDFPDMSKETYSAYIKKKVAACQKELSIFVDGD